MKANNTIMNTEMSMIDTEMTMIEMVNRHSDHAKVQRNIANLQHENRMLRNRLKYKSSTYCKINQYLYFLMMTISFCFLLYIGVSFFNVIMHNINPNCVGHIWDFNFFKVFFK